MAKEKITGIDYQLISKISELRVKNNYQTIKKEVGEERLKEFINSIYPKFSITEIETIIGIPDSTLAYWFEQLRIPFIRNHIYNVSLPSNTNSQIIVQKGAITQKVSSIKITAELAYLIGFSLGDGNIQKFCVDVFNKNKELRDFLFKILKKYGSITETVRDDNLWKLRLSNVKIANLIKDKNGIRQNTINYIFNNDKLARNFIAAFWDAEGSVLKQLERNKYYYHIYLYNTNEYLINKICEFLRNKDINYSIHKRKTRDQEAFLKDHAIKSNKILIRINVHKNSWLKWLNEIGFLMKHSKKRMMIKEIFNICRGNKYV